MTPPRPAPGQTRQWSIAGAVALLAHAAIAALALAWVKPTAPAVPEPVVLVELPEEASAAVAPTREVAPAAQVAIPQPATPLPFEVPQVRVPVSPQAVTTPPPSPPQVARPAPSAQQSVAAPPAAVAAPSGSGAGTGSVAGTDPRARQQEIDYFSLVSAHLNRRKTYPAEAKKARQHGVVTVRFTVDRNGAVSGAAIKKSSGHDLLDQATLDLLQRVAPLPRMPSSMQRDRVTLSLPIDYSLRTS